MSQRNEGTGILTEGLNPSFKIAAQRNEGTGILTEGLIPPLKIVAQRNEGPWCLERKTHPNTHNFVAAK